MSTNVSIVSNPVTVTVSDNKIAVSIQQPSVAVALSNTGPQGPPGPAGPAGGSYYAWSEITTVSQQAAVNSAYILNNASLITLTLPATAALGDHVQAIGKGAGGWKIAQNVGQTIHFGDQSTTQGAAGSLASQNAFDCAELVCITANTDWLVKGSQGNLTVT